MKHRVITFGLRTISERFQDLLADQEIEAVAAGSGSGVLALAAAGNFDLVVVDSSATEADSVCRCLRASNDVPVVLIAREASFDWSHIQSLEAIGYITAQSGEAELVARLKAVMRRLPIKI
jgi:DNA-binding response OmpR family regulator